MGAATSLRIATVAIAGVDRFTGRHDGRGEPFSHGLIEAATTMGRITSFVGPARAILLHPGYENDRGRVLELCPAVH